MSTKLSTYNLTINSLDAKSFNKYNCNNIYVHKDISLDMPIFRYVHTEYLIDLLSSDKLYISNRTAFQDKREQGQKENPQCEGPLSFVYHRKKKTEEEFQKRLAMHNQAYSTCISCWTKRSDENVMFWNCYGNDTCRIETTIKDLIFSLPPTDYEIVVAPVKYTENEWTELIQEKIFNKHMAYKDEQEIRLCVLTDMHHVMLDVDTKMLIKGIIINPFFIKSFQKYIKESIEQKYGFLKGKVTYSHLLEYK